MSKKTKMDDDGRIALSRNEVMLGHAGGRVWHGAFRSHSGTVHTELEAVVRFLDWNGHPLGHARGQAARLEPGEMLYVRAALPVAASMMRIERLRWRTGDEALVTLGPDRPWPFGHVPDPAGRAGMARPR